MKTKEEILERIHLAETALEQVFDEIRENDSYEFHDLLIDRKIEESTIIKILNWVLGHEQER